MIQSSGNRSGIGGAGSASILLARNPVPLIIAPTFTGTLVAGEAAFGTPIDYAYPQCFMYFDENTLWVTLDEDDVIIDGNTAGWYYVEMSDSGTGVVYNNTYVPAAGVNPEIPANPTAFADPIVGGAGFDGIVITHIVTLPANLIGDRGKLCFDGTVTVNDTTLAGLAITIGGENIITSALPAELFLIKTVCLHKGTGYVKNQIAELYIAFNAVDTTVDNDIVLALQTGDATVFCALLDYAVSVDNR